ncbi:Nn.00g025120.m01.CDS01 [Neocucurbitaria sp. VM-36]
MLSYTILLSGLLATLAAAQIDYCEGNKNTVGHCETLTYIDRTATSSNPPLATECQDTCRGVFGDAGDWGVDFRGKPEGYRQNMLLYPCGFSMGRAPGQPTDYQFSMDNQDIADILDEVSKRFAPLHGGRVAAEGLVRCDGFEATWYVD